MQKKIKAFLFVLLVIFFSMMSLNALEIPSLSGTPLHDNANLLNSSEHYELEQLLNQIDQQTDVQIAVLTVLSLEDNSIEDYAVRVFEEWKLGSATKDTGALLVIALDDRKIRIEVGYGLEGMLTDMICGQIIRNVIAPNFTSGNYGVGIYEAVKTMTGIVLNDESLIVRKFNQKNNSQNSVKLIHILLILYLIFGRRMLIKIPILGLLLRSSPFNGRINGGFSGGFTGFSGGGGSSGGGGASGGW